MNPTLEKPVFVIGVGAMNTAIAAAAAPPSSWAMIYSRASSQLMRAVRAAAKVTAGFICPPETFPKTIAVMPYAAARVRVTTTAMSPGI